MQFQERAVQLNRDLTSAIGRLVAEFEQETGIGPSDIDVRIADISTMATHKIIISVKLRFEV